MTWLRSVRVAIVLLALVQISVWVFAGWISWDFRYLMIGPGSPEVINRERFAIGLVIAAAINLIALVSFLLRVRLGWLFLTLVQIADAIVSLALLVTMSSDWWLVTTLAAITTVLLFAWRRIRPAPAA
jgi:hypothetical protein